MENPLGIDMIYPRLSWSLESERSNQFQSAYRILVASSPDLLDNNKGDLWDSGKISTDQSQLITYDGKELISRKSCYWKVQVWDKNGVRSKWSRTASWSIGLLDPEDWAGQWITCEENVPVPWFKKSFHIEKIPDQAMLYISSLGYYELFINGEKVGQEVLAPAVSNFSKRQYYRTYDVANLLHQGTNSLGIWMGTGWYSMGLPGVNHSSPVVRAQLELMTNQAHNQVCTDTGWLTKASDRSLLGTWRWGDFGGERVDANLTDPDWWKNTAIDSTWNQAILAEVPDVPCTAQGCAENTIHTIISPESVSQLDEETIVVDFGTNLTGMLEIHFRNLVPNQKVSLHYADLDGREPADQWRALQTKKQFAVYGQRDEFISSGLAQETFRNQFNYHAFRYVLIEGLQYLPSVDDLQAMAIETAVQETGEFSCSNDLYNRIHQMVRWTYRCLNLGGQTVDCPHRERLGYGDGQTIMDLGFYNFDVTSLYRKWSQNWWDEQGNDGFVPFTAPCPHNTGGGPAWGAMAIIVPWKTYLFSNDLELIRQGYPYMKKYMVYLDSYCEEEILQDIFPGERWPNLGDWVPPRRGMDKQDWVDDSSRRFFNNCYRVYLLQIMQQVATLLAKEEDAGWFEQKITRARPRIHEQWFNPGNNSYANGEQPYLIFPLKTGITPDSLREAVFEKYEQTLLVTDQGHLNTGMIGTQIMTDYLIEIGRNDLIDQYVNQTTYPGWGYMVENGATTCWEQWNGYFSQIHSCFPYIGSWFYQGLAGIQKDPDKPGFKPFLLRPAFVESLTWVNCSYDCPYGTIISNWKIDNNTLVWDIEIPVNTSATVYLPQNGDSHQKMELTSGTHRLTSMIR